MVLEGKPVVLVVDDDHLVTFSMAELLRSAGYLAITAPTAAVAIEAASGVAADLAIIDIKLPDRNGVDTALQICQLLPDCKILLITGHTNYSHMLENARAQGVEFEVLAKPISPPDLLTRLASLYPSKAAKAS